ncbi:MAG: F0F1 ATP synthase subunit epsilon [Bacteroidales bacterium]|jgi:F-type H+-transporting ATPase subunit epsilon|nr:F0F1 ATP synthase subunit epsilon [Bacteroidales bacterium]
MFVEIITPTKSLFSGSVKSVLVPGTKGAFEMLHNHAPIISTLEKGIVKLIDESGSEHIFDIAGGVVENADDKTIILVD